MLITEKKTKFFIPIKQKQEKKIWIETKHMFAQTLT